MTSTEACSDTVRCRLATLDAEAAPSVWVTRRVVHRGQLSDFAPARRGSDGGNAYGREGASPTMRRSHALSLPTRVSLATFVGPLYDPDAAWYGPVGAVLSVRGRAWTVRTHRAGLGHLTQLKPSIKCRGGLGVSFFCRRLEAQLVH